MGENCRQMFENDLDKGRLGPHHLNPPTSGTVGLRQDDQTLMAHQLAAGSRQASAKQVFKHRCPCAECLQPADAGGPS